MSKPDKRPVHVAEIKKTYKGKVHISTYLRRTFRAGGRVRHETVANISDLPDDLLAVIRKRLASKQPLVGDGGTMTIERSLPHGNVAAVLGTLRNIGLDQAIGTRLSRERSLVIAMIVDRMISPGSKHSCTPGMHPDAAQNTLAEELQPGEVEVHELYDAMDWLLERQTRIENELIRPIRHWNDDRIPAHVFLCMLAYYMESHMCDALREIIFDDAVIAVAQASRKSVLAKAKRWSSAKQTDATRLTPEGLPVRVC